MIITIHKSLFTRLILYVLLTGYYSGLLARQQEYIVYKGNNIGFFAIVNIVMGILDEFDQRRWAGVKVDLGRAGQYYDSKMGPNWWNYYFQPLQVGKNTGRIKDNPNGDYYGIYTLCRMSRQRGHYLLNKYIKIKPFVHRLVNNFYDKNLQGAYLIGIHYRGTDKGSEAAKVGYENAFRAVQNKINALHGKPYKIFVATDEQNFLNAIKSKFSNIYYTNSARSTDGTPLHYAHNRSPFKQGLECLIDALLLARCNTLIRTASHLSNTSAMFNPNIEFISLNTHYHANCPR